MLHRSVPTLLIAGAALASGLQAQGPLHAQVDLLAVHDYRWRGIPRATGWNLQLEGSARLGGPSGGIALGVWNNVELGTHRDGALSDLVPGHWGLSETDLWAELTRSLGWGDLAAGAVWYHYRGRDGRADTRELYARVRGSGMNKRSLSPELSVWYDPFERKSAYLDTGLTAPVLALPFRGLDVLAYVSGTAGFTIGTPRRPTGLAASTFHRAGLTAAELSAGFRMNGTRAMGGVLLHAAWHLQFANDSATRRRSLTPLRYSGRLRTYLTVGLGIRWPAPRDR